MTKPKNKKLPERDHWLQIRASISELNAWARSASSKGMTLSTWVRQALYAEAKRDGEG